MKLFFILLLSILMTLPVLAAEQVEHAAPPQQDKSAPQKTEKKSQPPVKTNFQPTEKIKADTVVAFPVDI